jgi:Flp pilus assembly protein TadG
MYAPLSLRRRRTDRGQSLVEFAMVAPILVLLIFGLVDLGRLYQAYVTVQGAARDGARYGVTGRSDCAGASDRYTCIQETAELQTDSLANHASAVSVTAQSWQFPGYSVANPVGDPGKQCDLLQVKVEYDFKPATPLLNKIIGPIHLSAPEKMVNEPFGPCSSS